MPNHVSVSIAASVTYRFCERPPQTSSDFDERPGLSSSFYSIRAYDGNEIAASLRQPQDRTIADTTLILMVHGSGGSYRRPPESTLSWLMAEKGFASLAIDTRQHDEHVNTDNFFHTSRDIQAAVHVARDLGYRSIVLQGHSLGNIQVQYFAATNWDGDIKGVVLLGAFANLPWKTEMVLVQDEERFRSLIKAAIDAKRVGDLGGPLPIAMRYFTGQDAPVTAQHFLTYRWGRTSAADGTFWIRRIPNPVLLIRDAADVLVQPFESAMLLSAARDEGSLVTSSDLVTLPNERQPSLGAHYFEHTLPALADALAGWLVHAVPGNRSPVAASQRRKSSDEDAVVDDASVC